LWENILRKVRGYGRKMKIWNICVKEKIKEYLGFFKNKQM